jgi:hypothetical protein
MMSQVCYYDSAERHQEKERHRASDVDDLLSGRISREQLRLRNGLFSSLQIIDSSVICEEAFV